MKPGTEVTFALQREGDNTSAPTPRTGGKLDAAFKDGTVAAESRAVRQVVSAP